jgi:hypothetical protein
MEIKEVGTVECQECGLSHVAEFHHVSPYGGHGVYAVICTTDNTEWLTDWYTQDVVRFDD